MKPDKLFTLCINQKKSLKKYATIKLIDANIKMDTILINSENSKTSKLMSNT